MVSRKQVPFFVLIALALVIGYFAGNAHLLNGNKRSRRVTSLGGVFFKCKDPEKLKAWYTKHLCFNMDEYGTMFEWRHADDPNKKGHTVWSPFKDNTTYFLPSQKEFMINYRVENMEKLKGELKNEGVEIVDTIASYDYGKFLHIMDPEGNKIELWEPVDTAQLTGKVTN